MRQSCRLEVVNSQANNASSDGFETPRRNRSIAKAATPLPKSVTAEMLIESGINAKSFLAFLTGFFAFFLRTFAFLDGFFFVDFLAFFAAAFFAFAAFFAVAFAAFLAFAAFAFAFLAALAAFFVATFLA